MGLAGLARWKTKSTGSATSMYSSSHVDVAELEARRRGCARCSRACRCRGCRGQTTRWPSRQQAFAQVRAEKAGAAGDHRVVINRLPCDPGRRADGPPQDLDVGASDHVPMYCMSSRIMSTAVEATAPAHLPEPRHAGQHGVAALVTLVHELDVAQGQRPRADEAHVPLQHVGQLGKLVEGRAPQEAADPGDARVVFDLEEAAVGFVAALAAPPAGRRLRRAWCGTCGRGTASRRRRPASCRRTRAPGTRAW